MEIAKNTVTDVDSRAAARDLLILSVILLLFLVLSYYFNVFLFIVELFQKNPWALTYIDEIVTALVVLSIGLAVYSRRRLLELRRETNKCILAERELAAAAATRAETERIVSKQLHAEIEQLLKFMKEDREMFLDKIEQLRRGH